MRTLAAAVLVAVLAIGGAAALKATASDSPVATTGSAARPIMRGDSGLPLPRFVSLKSDRVNVRVGPTQEHVVAWVFQRAGLPVEIVAEFGNWRRIRDSDGAEGWVYHSLLTGRRTAIVAPWSQGERVALRRRAREGADPVAILESGVLVRIETCDGAWCEVRADGHKGWLPQETLPWGVYPQEEID